MSPKIVSRFSASAAYATRKLASALLAVPPRQCQTAAEPRQERIVARAHREQPLGLVLALAIERHPGAAARSLAGSSLG